MLAPAFTSLRVKLAMYSGDVRQIVRPSTARGIPAFGIAANGLLVTGRIRSITLNTVAGPALQLHPTASAPHSVRLIAAVSADEPSRQFPSSSPVLITTTGPSGPPLL